MWSEWLRLNIGSTTCSSSVQGGHVRLDPTQRDVGLKWMLAWYFEASSWSSVGASRRPMTVPNLATDQKVWGSNPYRRADRIHRMTCANRFRGTLPREGGGPSPSQEPAQKLSGDLVERKSTRLNSS